MVIADFFIKSIDTIFMAVFTGQNRGTTWRTNRVRAERVIKSNAFTSESVYIGGFEDIVKAAIITHQNTGLTIVCHTTADGPAFAQLDLIEQAGLSPNAWVWAHAQECSRDGRLRAAKKGAWISLDSAIEEELDVILEAIIDLKSAGFLNQVLVSHDAGWYDPDKPDGGEIIGYTDIFILLLPALKEKGFSQTEIEQLLIGNPRSAYSIRVRTL